ncbi:MAG: tRNA pseudouridine(55) synthase TruB [Gammaproteobacteria bacterium]
MPTLSSYPERGAAVAGYKAVRRDVHGILLLDKPERMTSNQALQTVKRLFNARKAGHTGSLDPLATGLLPICFGEATKLSAFLLDADKEYLVTCRLGVRTATGDAEGAVTEQRAVPALTRVDIEATLGKFRGEIDQVPPMYSALKHQGQRLYDLARDGIEVARAPRRVTIHALTLSSCDAASLTLAVRCSKGTYIRTLVEDLARALGSCGHVSALRRLALGPYGSIFPMHTLVRLQRHVSGDKALDELLLPADSAIGHWPAVRLGTDATWYFMRGHAVAASGAPTHGRVRVYAPERFLGVGEVLDDGRITPRRLLNFA